jgi:uncharacterized protein YuzE
MPKMALLTRDPATGVYSVDLEDGEVARTAQLDDSHLVDLADDGRVLSIEILTPDDPKIEEMAAAFEFEDRVPEILDAIRAAFSPPIKTVVIAFQAIQIVEGEVAVFGADASPGNSAGTILPQKITLS